MAELDSQRDSAPGDPPEDDTSEPDVDEPETSAADDDEDRYGDPEPEEGDDSDPGSADEPEFPEHWPEAERETLAALPPESREKVVSLIREKEANFNRGLNEAKTKLSEWETAVEPFRPFLAQLGVPEPQMIQSLLQARVALQHDPRGTLRQLAQAFGVRDLDDDGGDIDDDDPTMKELKALREEVNRLRQGPPQGSQNVHQQIAEFRNAKDDQGNPKHPHFDKVRTHMAQLVQQGKSLEDAYEEAVWLVPEVREAKLREQREEAARRTEEERRKRAKAAKSRSRSVSGGNPPPRSTSKQDEDADIATLLRQGFEATEGNRNRI